MWLRGNVVKHYHMAEILNRNIIRIQFITLLKSYKQVIKTSGRKVITIDSKVGCYIQIFFYLLQRSKREKQKYM